MNGRLIMDNNPAAEIAGEILSQIRVLTELHDYLLQILADDVSREGKNRKNGLVVAGLLENYYTAAETVMFRIAQTFGNSIDGERWHADLLHRLTIEVNGIRPRVLTDDSYSDLDELRRFRHFKRYYYRIEYDWDKLDFLIRKLQQLHPRFVHELNAFREFTLEIENE
jgi:hypothetical protein